MTKPRATVALSAAALTAITLSTWAPAAAAPPSSAPSPAARTGVATDYGFAGRAYGSVAKASPMAAGSAPSAPTFLACTTRAGVARDNFVASTGGGAGSALEVTRAANSTRSYRSRNQMGTRSVSRVADAVLGTPDGAHITLEGVRTVAKAYVQRRTGRLRASATTTADRVEGHTGTPLDRVLAEAGSGAGLDALLEAVADAGGTLLVPGLGELQAGEGVTRSRRTKAVARVSALKAKLYGEDGLPGGGDDVRAVVARSRAVVYDKVTGGVFRGRSIPLESRVGGGLLEVGRVVDKPMPCPGTGGKVQQLAASGLDLGRADLIEVATLRARVHGVQDGRSARGWSDATVSSVELGGGEVRITGLTGRVNVRTDARGSVVRNDIRGSRVGSLVIGGERQRAPRPGDVIEVPDLATLEFFLRERGARGADVVALRVTLLPGTPGESVIDLGHARTYLTRS